MVEVFLLTVAAALADVSHLGYHYKVPQTSYGVPSYQNGDYQKGDYQKVDYQKGNSDKQNSAFSNSFSTGSLSGSQGTDDRLSSGLGNTYYQSSGVSGLGSIVNPGYYYAANSGLNTGFQTQYSSSSQYQASEKYNQQYDIKQQPTQVFKHFYVHAAPEEPEPPKPRVPIVLPPAQKHYKIIFVKVPQENYRSQAVVPVQTQNEEKTIVYVLVKKPEEQHDVIVPKVEQKPPTKPEVFFIKYGNKDDSQALINNIVKDYHTGDQVSILNSGAAEGTLSSASGNSDTSYSSASSGFNGYELPLPSPVGTVSQSFGAADNQGVISVSSANSGADFNQENIASSFASSIAPPVIVSSTASSVGFEGASALSTSQGVPHETYGPPKFRLE